MPRRPDTHHDDHPSHVLLRSLRRERAVRFGRIRRWMRHLPRRSNLHSYPVLRWFADAAHQHPFLWTFRAPGPRRAVYLGSVLSLLPLYGLQIVLAFVFAIVFRANLAITVGLQAITNPLTAAPIYYSTYRVGSFLLDRLGVGLETAETVGPVGAGVQALFLGGLVSGLALGFVLDLVGRFLAWEADQLRRRHRLAQLESERLRRSRTPGAAVDPRPPT